MQGSVSYESAVGERPVGRVRVRVPAGTTNPDPKDFNEFSLDYPARPYRAEALALNPVHYWTLDEGPSTLAIDHRLRRRRTSPTRAAISTGVQFVQDAAGVPYGAAPEWSQTAGDGLSGTIGAVGTAFVIAGFVRLAAGATGTRAVFRAGANARRLLLSSAGALTLHFDGSTISAAVTLAVDRWYHVAIRRTAGRQMQLWVDGVRQ